MTLYDVVNNTLKIYDLKNRMNIMCSLVTMVMMGIYE